MVNDTQTPSTPEARAYAAGLLPRQEYGRLSHGFECCSTAEVPRKSQAFCQHLSAAPPMSTQPLEGMEASVPNWQALTGSAESCKAGIAGDSCKASSVAEAVSAPDSCCLNVVAVNRPSADTGVVAGERVLFSSKALKLAVIATLQDKCWQCLQRQMLITAPHGRAANKTYRWSAMIWLV